MGNQENSLTDMSTGQSNGSSSSTAPAGMPTGQSVGGNSSAEVSSSQVTLVVKLVKISQDSNTYSGYVFIR